MGKHRGVTILLLVAALLGGVVPLAEVHGPDESSVTVTEPHGHAPDHAAHSVPTADGGHVHFHHCCPHAPGTAGAFFPTAPAEHGFTVPMIRGELLAGSLTTPFRPPAG